MKIVLVFAAALLASAVYAQDDSEDFDVVLPDGAQKCVLPASPDKIPDEASLDDLKVAKGQIGEFQASMLEFRGCLEAADADPDNTPGNKQAIVNSYNYSVEMEERVANRFNEAVRDYKARKAAAEG